MASSQQSLPLQPIQTEILSLPLPPPRQYLTIKRKRDDVETNNYVDVNARGGVASGLGTLDINNEAPRTKKRRRFVRIDTVSSKEDIAPKIATIVTPDNLTNDGPRGGFEVIQFDKSTARFESQKLQVKQTQPQWQQQQQQLQRLKKTPPGKTKILPPNIRPYSVALSTAFTVCSTSGLITKYTDISKQVGTKQPQWNFASDSGTILHACVHSCDIDTIRFLMDTVANLDYSIRDSLGYTARELAGKMELAEIETLLRSREGGEYVWDVFIVDRDGGQTQPIDYLGAVADVSQKAALQIDLPGILTEEGNIVLDFELDPTADDDGLFEEESDSNDEGYRANDYPDEEDSDDWDGEEDREGGLNFRRCNLNFDNFNNQGSPVYRNFVEGENNKVFGASSGHNFDHDDDNDDDDDDDEVDLYGGGDADDYVDVIYSEDESEY